MGRIDTRLDELGLMLPAPMSPPGNAKVVNGFSDLIVEIWGDAGRHVRSAAGQGPSPLNVPIIVDAFVAVTEP